MKLSAGQLPVDQFQRTDFDDAMPLPGVETCGFSIEYDLTHAYLRVCCG